MKSLRGSTFSPMRMVKVSSAATASSRVMRRNVRFSGSMVVSQSSWGFISPRPLKREMSIFTLGFPPRISALTASRSGSE